MIDPDGMSADTTKVINMKPFTIIAPRLDPFTGFSGTLNYYANMGNFGDFHYRMQGQLVSPAPRMRFPQDLNGFGFSLKNLNR